MRSIVTPLVALAAVAVMGLLVGGDLIEAQSSQHVIVCNNFGGGWTVTAQPPIAATAICGDVMAGAIIAGGRNNREVYLLNNFGGGNWTRVPDAPVNISGIDGNVLSGAIIYGGRNNRQVYICNNFGQGNWTAISNAPFNIRALVGDVMAGVAILGPNNEIAICNNFAQGSWTILASPPFQNISGMSGNLTHGLVVFGGRGNRQLAVNRNFATNQWNQLPDAPWTIQAIDWSIDPNAGCCRLPGGCASQPVILSSNQRTIAYLQGGNWSSINAQTPFSTIGLTGDSINGVVGLTQ